VSCKKESTMNNLKLTVLKVVRRLAEGLLRKIDALEGRVPAEEALPVYFLIRPGQEFSQEQHARGEAWVRNHRRSLN
jgi:hypothetical protein